MLCEPGAALPMSPSWIELQIELASEGVELLAEAVGEVTGGVEVRDSGTLIRVDPGRSAVVALCEPERMGELLAAIDDVCARARAAGLAIDPVVLRHRDAHEDEWRDVWKKYFRATRVGETFIVRPSWDLTSVAAGPGDRVIDLDPGRAFGTGGHASTRLVIALAEVVARGRAAGGGARRAVDRFLDLGCGSGILAIAAARLWPEADGLAVDNDPEATACTQENLERNQIARVKVATGTLADAGGGSFDVVLANIQADVLLAIAADLAGRLAAGGALILSGLLRTDAPAVTERYQQLGLTLAATREEDEWTALLLENQGDRD
ncbi:MAG TPA: 50S ribosomal protein L11 methyltransferase [Polyangia bacterium]|nr:50S ribosomal protein L11 methyltransferase [Polyangia bacterium]